MMRFVLLVGLPGCGKTTYGRSLPHPFVDDLEQNGGLNALHNTISQAIVDRADTMVDDTIVISDHAFVFPRIRALAIQYLTKNFPDSSYELVFWENAPDKCKANIVRRDDGRAVSYEYLKQLSQFYEIPEGATVLPVFQPKVSI